LDHVCQNSQLHESKVLAELKNVHAENHELHMLCLDFKEQEKSLKMENVSLNQRLKIAEHDLESCKERYEHIKVLLI
jgi:hypothetical protein